MGSEDALERISLADDETTLAEEADWLWDADEGERFVRLALRHPSLLTHEEQIKWKRLAERVEIGWGVG